MFYAAPGAILMFTNNPSTVKVRLPGKPEIEVWCDREVPRQYPDLWLAIYLACSNPGKLVRHAPCRRNERQWEDGNVKACCFQSKLLNEFTYQGTWTKRPTDL